MMCLAKKLLNVYRICVLILGLAGVVASCNEPPKEIIIQQGDCLFFVFSDTGADGSLTQREVARVADSMSVVLNPQFIVHTGDCFHGKGLSSPQDTTTIQANFEGIYQGSLAQKDWYPILGNHEYCGNPQAIVEYATINPRWKMSNRYYSQQRSLGGKDSLLMLFIDTSPYVKKYRKKAHYTATHGMDETDQTRWIDSVLHHATAKWKIVFGHHPIFTGDFGHGNTRELINLVQPLMKQTGVQAYFSGHIHNFQHSKRQDMDYFSTSTGGLESRFSHPWFGTKHFTSQPGFTVCVVNSRRMLVYFVSSKGKLLYQGCVHAEKR